MRATVVVPTFNRSGVAVRTVRALLNQEQPAGGAEVIVVDDASGDDTEAAFQELALTSPRLLYLRNAVNRGRAATRNRGIEAARGSVVIFLDDDNEPAEGFVAAHLARHERGGAAGVAVMGNPRFAESAVAGSNFAKYVDDRYLGQRLKAKGNGLDGENLPARCFGTLNASVARETLLKIGMFDEDLACYGGEDVLLGYRLREAGVRIVFEPEARSIHFDEVSMDRYRLKYEEVTREGFPVILSKYPDFAGETAIRLLAPVDWSRDSASVAVQKIVVGAVLSEPLVRALEGWARLTDGIPACRSDVCFRALMAGWHRRGFRKKREGVSKVHYGANEGAGLKGTTRAGLTRTDGDHD